MKTIWLGLILCIAVPFLGACGSDESSPVNDNRVRIDVDVSGTQVVPSVNTGASATGEVTVDTIDGSVSGFIQVIDLAAGNVVGAAHIHNGAPGANGSVMVALVQDAVDETRWLIPENTVLDSTDRDNVLAGLSYFNVHTTNNSSGELRGQILPPGLEMTINNMDGEQQVPVSAATTASGKAYVLYDSNTGRMIVNARMNDISGITAAHIHQGIAGSNGGIAQTMSVNAGDASWYELDADLSSAAQTAYGQGGLYVNIHTSGFGSGELRGQILPNDTVMVRTLLDGDQVPGGVTTGATGVAYITLNAQSGAVQANIRVFDLTTDTAAHIHQGVAGQSGGVVAGFTANGSDPDLWELDSTFDSDALDAFGNNGLYYNVHSSAFASGEIRGQIVPE